MFCDITNRNSNETKSHFQEKRSEERFEIPVIVTINGTDYIAQDWSAGGCKVKHLKGNYQVGDCLPIHLVLNLKGGIQFSLDMLAEIVWRSPEQQTTGFRFLNLREPEKELIEQLGSDFQEGKLTPEDANINSKTLTQSQFFQQKDTSQNQPQKSRRFWLATVGLSLLGLAILSATGVALYRAIAFMHIDSAAIARSYKDVISTHRGKLSQLYVSEGMEVTAGDPLFRIYDEQMAQFVAEDQARNIQQIIRDKRENVNQLQQELELTQTKLEEAKTNLKIARSRQQKEVQKLQVSAQITQKQLQQAKARVKALETQYQTAQKSLERANFLNRQGAIAEERVDNAKARLAEVKGKLNEARKEVEIKQDMLATMDQGSFYNGERFNGNVPELEAKAAQASEAIAQKSREINVYQTKIDKQQQAIRELEKQYRDQNFQLPQTMLSDPSEENIFSQVYDAPIDATVSKIQQGIGQPVQIGQTILILEPERDRVTVDAFLTQDQAARVTIGHNVEVTVPDLDQTYRATVTKIDRSGGLRDEIRGRYQFEGSTTRPAYVQLVVIGATKEERNRLTPGTPVELTIRKQNY